jgi:UDP:flavonoid glycosyltransferase YjiC (YdhE family)
LKREKYSISIPAVENHVRIEDFVPQAQILAHPKVRVFMSHCGQNSIQEAIWTETPVLALPFMGDQVGVAWW